MASKRPLKSMSLEEKLQAMESLWDDLCDQLDGASSPLWHEDVLAQRDAARERGDDGADDWNESKNEIRHNVS